MVCEVSIHKVEHNVPLAHRRPTFAERLHYVAFTELMLSRCIPHESDVLQCPSPIFVLPRLAVGDLVELNARSHTSSYPWTISSPSSSPAEPESNLTLTN